MSAILLARIHATNRVLPSGSTENRPTLSIIAEPAELPKTSKLSSKSISKSKRATPLTPKRSIMSVAGSFGKKTFSSN